MTEAAVTASVESDVTDAQVNDFFESGGDSVPGGQDTPKEAQDSVTGALEGQDTVTGADTVQGAQKPDKTVPLAALHQERERRKELQSKVSQMETRFNQLMERLQKPEPQVPAFEENPAEHLRQKQVQLEQQIQQQTETVQQAEARRAQEAQLAQFDNAYKSAAMEYAQQTPGFTDAYQHLIASRKQAYEQMGVEPSEYAARLQHEERQIAHTAFTLGINPGVLLQNLAVAAGFKPKPEKPQPNIQTLAKGVQAKSIASEPSTAKQNMTLEALAEMDDKDFEANWDKLIKG
jgi:hypothetical protein